VTFIELIQHVAIGEFRKLARLGALAPSGFSLNLAVTASA
jgi:hypothetical protein